MIKTAIKHYILEACINVFFDKLTYNFRKPSLTNIHGIKVGDRFTEIWLFDDSVNYVLGKCRMRYVTKTGFGFSYEYLERYDDEWGSKDVLPVGENNCFHMHFDQNYELVEPQ